MTGSVCLYVREHISRTTCPIFTKFLCLLPMPAARSSSGGVAICYVLPVLWYMVRNRRRNRDSMGSSTDLSRRRTLKLVHQGPEPDRGAGRVWPNVRKRGPGQKRRRKVDRDGADITLSGRLLQTVGPATGKDRPPTVDSFTDCRHHTTYPNAAIAGTSHSHR